MNEINKYHDYLSKGIDSELYLNLIEEIHKLSKIIEEKSESAELDSRAIQDTSSLACINLNENECEVLFSQYGKLTTIKNEDLLSEGLLIFLTNLFEERGFIYMPENGECFRNRERMNGDWFHTYFDYK